MIDEGEITEADRLTIWKNDNYRQLGIDAMYTDKAPNALVDGLRADALKSKDATRIETLMNEMKDELKRCIAAKECV
jgi:hypothetical protein